MARETAYIVQAFDAGKGGRLKPDSPIACKSATVALRLGSQAEVICSAGQVQSTLESGHRDDHNSGQLWADCVEEVREVAIQDRYRHTGG